MLRQWALNLAGDMFYELIPIFATHFPPIFHRPCQVTSRRANFFFFIWALCLTFIAGFIMIYLIWVTDFFFQKILWSKIMMELMEHKIPLSYDPWWCLFCSWDIIRWHLPLMTIRWLGYWSGWSVFCDFARPLGSATLAMMQSLGRQG